jgi:hypothetical protein
MQHRERNPHGVGAVTGDLLIRGLAAPFEDDD